MMRGIGAAFALIWLIAAPVCAQPYATDWPYGTDWQAALDGASPRLQLFSLLSAHPDGAGERVAALQRSAGFAHQAGQGAQFIARGAALAPILAYDANINSGTPGSVIMIAGLPFAIAPASQAKSGLIGGAAVSGRLQYSLARGLVLDGTLSASAAKSWAGDLGVQSYDASLCAGQFLGGANWVDLCLGGRGSRRALSSGDEQFISIGFSRQFASTIGLHEAGMRLRHSDYGSYSKLLAEFDLTTARAQMGVLAAQIALGENVAGHHTRLFGVNLALTRPIFGAKTTIFARYAHEGGSVFFGTPRRDDALSIGFSRPLNPKISASFFAQFRNSTLENYDGVTFGVDFTLHRF